MSELAAVLGLDHLVAKKKKKKKEEEKNKTRSSDG